jgi:hypothetical protein
MIRLHLNMGHQTGESSGIACNGGDLKNCLPRGWFQVEMIRKTGHFELQAALDNWKTQKRISI